MDTLIYKIVSDIDKLSHDVVQLLRKNNKILVTAESCTGGLLSGAVTSVSGVSEAFGLGLCTYANGAKEKFLGVNPDTLKRYGAVSRQTALEMAHGAINNAMRIVMYDTDNQTEERNITAVSVTGIAGPGGGTPEKPVGTVYFAFISDNMETLLHLKIDASPVSEELRRSYIRLESVRQALILVKDTLQNFR